MFAIAIVTIVGEMFLLYDPIMAVAAKQLRKVFGIGVDLCHQNHPPERKSNHL